MLLTVLAVFLYSAERLLLLILESSLEIGCLFESRNRNLKKTQKFYIVVSGLLVLRSCDIFFVKETDQLSAILRYLRCVTHKPFTRPSISLNKHVLRVLVNVLSY